MADVRQLAALVRLWDDSSERVRVPVRAELAAFGEELPALLRALPEPPDEPTLTALLDAVARQAADPVRLEGRRRGRAEGSRPARVRDDLDDGEDEDDELELSAEQAATLEAAFEALASEAFETSDDSSPRFEVGLIVRHRRYGYRGVVVHADPYCRASEAWYRSNRTTPARDQPWYYVLVSGTDQVTYAAESSLLADETDEDVRNQFVPVFFDGRSGPRYRRNDRPWPGWMG